MMFIKETLYVVCSNLAFSQHQRPGPCTLYAANLAFSQHQRPESRNICCELEQQKKKITDRPTHLIFQRSGYGKQTIS